MRPRTSLREPRLMQAAVGAMILAGPTTAAFADAPRPAPPQPPANQTLRMHVRSHRLGYGDAVLVSGEAPTSEAGQTVALDFAPLRTGSWKELATARVTATGSFRLTAPLRSSGQVKVSAASPSAPSPLALSADTSSTAPQRVAVAAEIHLRHHASAILGSGTVNLRGELIPRLAGRRVVLQAWRGRRWVTLAATRTRSSGRFGLRYRAGQPGQLPLRVRFAGDRANASASRPAGRIAVLHPSMASWYQDAGNTACGFHAYYGVANLSLPCGAHVTLSSGGRTVTATVDDRGPYVGGREWDLNQNTAAALGFGGVGTVWSSS